MLNQHYTLTQPQPTWLMLKLDEFYNKRFNQSWRGRHIMRGRTASNNSIQLISNDYLSLANHTDILEAQTSALANSDQYLLMSAIFLHGNNPQMDLESRFAQYLHADEAVLCQSGYAANVGLIQALVENTQSPVYIDMYAHMSLWDGVRMAGVPATPFRHNDVEHLRSAIKKRGPGLVLVDSVYSTNGSVCPLKELVELAWAMGCTILVDESHSLGTHGPQGKGMVVELGLENKVMFRTASLAKAFAGRAGIITCPQGFGDFFKFTSKPSIFSSALLPHEIAGLNKTLDLIIRADSRREQLRKNTSFLRQSLDALGYNVDDSDAQIIALESGSEWNTILLRDALEKRDVFGSVFCAPATAKSRALIRFSINATLTSLQLQYIIHACKEVAVELDVDKWRSSQRKQRKQKVVSTYHPVAVNS